MAILALLGLLFTLYYIILIVGSICFAIIAFPVILLSYLVVFVLYALGIVSAATYATVVGALSILLLPFQIRFPSIPDEIRKGFEKQKEDLKKLFFYLFMLVVVCILSIFSGILVLVVMGALLLIVERWYVGIPLVSIVFLFGLALYYGSSRTTWKSFCEGK